MVVYDLNVLRVRPRPTEAHPELIVDAYTVLPGPIVFQGFQSVAWGNAQVVQLACLVQLLQFPARHDCEVDETCDTLPIEQGGGVRTFERLDHKRIVTLRMINVKRDY